MVATKNNINDNLQKEKKAKKWDKINMANKLKYCLLIANKTI